MNRRGFLKSALLALVSVPLAKHLIPWRKYAKGSICPACGSAKVVVEDSSFECFGCGAEGCLQIVMKVSKWPEHILEQQKEAEQRLLREYYRSIYPQEYVDAVELDRLS